MVFAPLLAAPTLMFLAAWVERRLGPAAGGAIAAMPFSIAIIVVALGADGPAVAASAAAHVPAQVAFALVFAAVIVRRGGWAGLAAGAVAYAGASLALALIPLWAAIALAVPALCARVRGLDGVAGGGRVDARVGSVVVMGVVGAALLAADRVGPGFAGIVAAFPTLSASFVLLLERARGREAAACALGGLIVGLRSYLAFCVLVAVSGSVLLGLAGVAAMNVTAARSLRLSTASLRGTASGRAASARA